MSQPTLSTQVKKLEEDLGIPLFERTHKRVMPTPTGQAIIAQARVVLEEAGKLRQMAQQAEDPMAGPLRLGVIPTLGPYLLPYLIPQIRASSLETLRQMVAAGVGCTLLPILAEDPPASTTE